MRATLNTTVTVRSVQAWAELDFFEEQPEIAHLCRVACERGRLDEQAVLAALPGLSERAAGRLLVVLRTLGLCEAGGALTQRGVQAARGNGVPVPEQGVYRIALVQHPATGERILHAERLRPSDVAPDAGQGEHAPQPVVPQRHRPFRSVVPGGPTVALRGEGFAPCAVNEQISELRLRWTLDFDKKVNRLHVEGQLPGGFRHRDCEDQGETVELDLDAVLDGWNDGWMAGRWNGDFFEVAYDEVQKGTYGQDAVETLRANFPLTDVPVLRLGRWSGEIQDVLLGPRERRDGERWGRFLLLRQLERESRVRSWTEVRERYRRLVEESTLRAVEPAVPGFEELWREAREERPAVAMRLAAAVDLAPKPLPGEALAPRPWAGGDAFVADEAERFSLPHGVRLPMRKLAEKLLRPARGTVQRLLYVDRYATKPDNLPNLRALAACLTGPLDVVTGDEDGHPDWDGKVWSFSAFFGRGGRRHQPHDRYLLVRTDRGTVVWHLSNALLDGRLDEGKASEDPDRPLRWRDLSANLEDLAHLPEAMRSWANGGIR